MSFASIHPNAFLALRTTVKNNAHYISENEVLYPAGAVLILHDYSKKEQRYIPLNEKSIFLEMIIVSPSRSLGAVIINDEKGHIVIYDMKSLKKKKTLNLPHDSTTKRFEHMCFSHDEKLLLTLTGEPDWMMLSYNWEKGKVETFTRANYINNPGPVSQVLSSPTDSAVCCILGPALFRLMTMQETVWRQYGFQKAEQVNVTSAAFLGSDRVIVGTADGRLLMVDTGELKGVYDAVTVQVITVVEKDEGATTQPVQIPKLTRKDSNIDRQVRSITPINKGFSYSCEVGKVHMFEREDKNVYRRRNLFTITDADFREEKLLPLNIVQHMSVSPQQNKIMATTNRSQLYAVKLGSQSLTEVTEIEFKHLGESLHHGPISGLAMCVWKPLFMTCGAQDRTVRLWNYETAKLEMVKQYEEDVLSVALHPTALFAAIGFTDKLRYMIVLLDDIQPFRTFPITDCHLSSFSYNGHYLAAVNRLVIIVFSTISFRVVCTLKGHSAKVTSLAWTPDDSILVSCGTDGAVYEWDVASGSRKGEIVDKGICYWECDVTSNGKFIYAVGNDGKLKEINDSNVLRIFGLGQNDLPHVTLSRSDLMMFVCGESGIILSVKMPIIEPVDRKSFLYHNSKILQMKLTYDDKTLLTVSETGSLCIWDIEEADGRAIEIDKDFVYCSDVLIPKHDLEDKVATIYELDQRRQELLTEHEYQAKQTEVNHGNNIKQLHATYEQQLMDLRNEMARNEKENSRVIENMTTDSAALVGNHEIAKQEMEAKHNLMLLVEYEKLREAEEARRSMACDYENQISAICRKKDEEAESMKREFLNEIEQLERKVKQLKNENEQERLEHAEIKEQIENDADREIIELKAEYEKSLNVEREMYVKVRGEEGVMRKKLGITVKDNETFKMDIACLQNQLSKSQGEISSLNQDIRDLKNEIYERDLTIQEKEKRIYDMKKVTEELEKYKFVLSHKIQELQNQLDPKEVELEEKDKQIVEMEWEMTAMQTANENMEVEIDKLKEKIKTSEKEIKKVKEKSDGMSNTLKRVSGDVNKVSKNLQDPKKLKEGIRYLYDKYVDETKGDDSSNEIEDELLRQRDYLEHTVETLRNALAKARNKPGDSSKTMKENVMLLHELQSLRSSNEILQEKIDLYEPILLSSSGKINSLSEVKKRLAGLFKDQERMKLDMQNQIDSARGDADRLQQELNRLRKECLH